MKYEKQKVTICLENEDEIADFWELLMSALDYNLKAPKSKKLTSSQKELADKLEEIVRPNYG